MYIRTSVAPSLRLCVRMCLATFGQYVLVSAHSLFEGTHRQASVRCAVSAPLAAWLRSANMFKLMHKVSAPSLRLCVPACLAAFSPMFPGGALVRRLFYASAVNNIPTCVSTVFVVDTVLEACSSASLTKEMFAQVAVNHANHFTELLASLCSIMLYPDSAFDPRPSRLR